MIEYSELIKYSLLFLYFFIKMSSKHASDHVKHSYLKICTAQEKNVPVIQHPIE